MMPGWEKNHSVLGLVILVLASSALLAAESQEWKAPARASRRKNPLAASDQSIAAGKIIYEKNCLSCHGAKGQGDGPAAKDLDKKPGDLSSEKVQAQSDGAFFWKISEGRKPMPTFEKLLSEEERWHVINYSRTLAVKAATP